MDSLKSQGFYELYDEKKNLRIIAMNTQACDTLNFFLMQNPTDPWGELKWLREVLQDVESKHQHAFLFAHVRDFFYFFLKSKNNLIRFF